MGSDLFRHGYLSNVFLKLHLNESISSLPYVLVDESVVSVKWHNRFGHIRNDRMNRLAKEGLLGYLKKVSLTTFESCLSKKAHTKSFGEALMVNTRLFLFNSNICACSGAAYFLLLLMNIHDTITSVFFFFFVYLTVLKH